MPDRQRPGLDRREFLRRAGALGVGLSLPGTVLAACGSSDSSTGGVLSVGGVGWLPADFFVENSLDTHLVGYSQIAWALFMSKGSGYEYRDGLASGYEVSEDGRTHTITVREGITFHDGSPIDAEAVAANLRGTFFNDDPLHRGSGAYIQVTITLGDPPIVRSVEAVDERTVQVKLSEYRSDIKTALAFILILNPRVLNLKNYGTNVKALAEAGSGPFRLTRFAAGDFMELARYEDFFEEVVPERVRVQQFTDPGALALALQNGDVAVASGLAKADYDRFARSGFQQITSEPAVNVDLVFSNPKDPAFRDVRVRRAMGLAMNREAYTERFFSSGTATVSSQPIIPPGLPGYVEALEPEPYDPDAARSLLADAGVRSAKLTLDGSTSQAPISSTKGFLEAVAEDLRQVGIDASVRVVDGAANATLLEDGKVDMFVAAPGGQPDPFILFDLFFVEASPYAPAALPKYPDITKALARAHVARGVGERDRLLRGIIQQTTDERLLLPISVVDYSAIAAKSVKGFPLSCTALDSWHRASA